MKQFFKKNVLNNFKNYVVKNTEPGKTADLLKVTAAVGWAASSISQISAILINDKIPEKEKRFMIPQEMMDAGINIGLFLLFTSKFKEIGDSLVKKGRIVPDFVKKELDKGQKIDDVLNKLDTEKLKEFKKFAPAVGTGLSIVGSIIACNIVTPLVRNFAASVYQGHHLKKERNEAPEVKQHVVLNPKNNEAVRTFYKTKVNKSNTNFSSGMKI